MDSTIRTDLENYITNAESPAELTTLIEGLKIKSINLGEPDKVRTQIDQVVSCSQTGKRAAECIAEIVDGRASTSGSCTIAPGTSEIDNGVERLRACADEMRPKTKVTPEDKEALRSRFNQFYDAVRPRVEADDLDDFDAEADAIRDFRLFQPKPLGPYLDAWWSLAMGFGNLSYKLAFGPALDFGFLDLSYALGNSGWNIPPVLLLPFLAPIPGYPNARLHAGQQHTLLTRSEQKSLALLYFEADAIILGAYLTPTGSPETFDEPRDAEKPDYTEFGIPRLVPTMDMPNNAWKKNLNDTFRILSADSLGAIAQKRLLLAGQNHLGIPALSLSGDAILDISKLLFISPAITEIQADIDRTDTLTMGEDGDECSEASDAEVEYFRVANPQYVDLTDEEIMELICAARPQGSNTALPSAKRGGDVLVRNRLERAYLLTAFHRNLVLTDQYGTLGISPWVPLGLAAAVAVAQPFANQAMSDDDHVGRDFKLEGAAALATAASYNQPELRASWGFALQQWSNAFNQPDFFLRLAQHVDGEKRFLAQTTFWTEVLFVPQEYFYGVEHGDMFTRGIRRFARGDALEGVQYISPLLAGAAAHIARKIRYYNLRKPDGVEIEGLSSSEVADLQEEYSGAKKTGWAHVPEWTAFSLYLGGALVGALTSNEDNPEPANYARVGENGGLLGGNILGAPWAVNLDPRGGLMAGLMVELP